MLTLKTEGVGCDSCVEYRIACADICISKFDLQKRNKALGTAFGYPILQETL